LQSIPQRYYLAGSRLSHFLETPLRDVLVQNDP